MSATPPPGPVVFAAGGLVVRGGAEGPEVLLVHRPRYDDWSFPKGKRDGDETDEQTALREVLEETGITCRLGPQIAEVRYRDHRDRPKVVRYWLMEPDAPEATTEAAFTPGDEVDALRWCREAEADRLLTYAHDRSLLAQLGRLR